MTHLLKICLLLVLMPLNLMAQDEKPTSYSLNGYVKNMQTYLIPNDLDLVLFENLVHNRLRFNIHHKSKWRFNLEMRNRIISGDLVRLIPGYSRSVDRAANDYFDFSEYLIDKQSILFHSVIDRAHFEYFTGSWEFSFGRQRINWGIGTTWNPNDYFNAFSFIDFDYEERPGSDAILIRKYFGSSTSAEVVGTVHDDWSEAIIAGLIKLNIKGYDVQLSGGKVLDDAVLGLGWAGNLGNAGFKGEASYFITPDQDDNIWVVSASVDYSFGKGWYFNNGFLVTTDAQDELNFFSLLDQELSSKNLYPYRFSILSQWGFQPGPLSNAGMTIVFSPGKDNTIFLSPTYQWSISQNWDVDLIAQIIFQNDDNTGYHSPGQNVFARVKWNF